MCTLCIDNSWYCQWKTQLCLLPISLIIHEVIGPSNKWFIYLHPLGPFLWVTNTFTYIDNWHNIDTSTPIIILKKEKIECHYMCWCHVSVLHQHISDILLISSASFTQVYTVDYLIHFLHVFEFWCLLSCALTTLGS